MCSRPFIEFIHPEDREATIAAAADQPGHGDTGQLMAQPLISGQQSGAYPVGRLLALRLEEAEAGVDLGLGRLQLPGKLAMALGNHRQASIVLAQLFVKRFPLLHQAEDTVFQLRGPPA